MTQKYGCPHKDCSKRFVCTMRVMPGAVPTCYQSPRQAQIVRLSVMIDDLLEN